MVQLTSDEKALFTSEQLAQLERLSDDRVEEYLTPPKNTNVASFRAIVLGKLAKRSSEELRARVNIIGISWGEQVIINWAPENDYTQEEVETLQDAMAPGVSLISNAPTILANGLSLRQRVRKIEESLG